MNKNLIWVLSFSVLILFSFIIVSDYSAEFSLVYAIKDNSNVLFYTEGFNKYNMSELLEWYNFSMVNVIFLENESLIAKKVIVENKLSVKRSKSEIRKLVQDDKELIMSYPIIARQYIEKKSSKNNVFIIPNLS